MCPDDIDISSWNALPLEIQLEIIEQNKLDEKYKNISDSESNSNQLTVSNVVIRNPPIFVDSSFKPSLCSIDGRKEAQNIGNQYSKNCGQSFTDQCYCKLKTAIRQVSKQGPNQGRYYSSCNKRTCNFFAWADFRATVMDADSVGNNEVNYKYQNLEWLPFLPGGPYCLMFDYRNRLLSTPLSRCASRCSLTDLAPQPLCNDILQGGVGDCWFLGALAVVAERRDLLQQILRPLLASVSLSLEDLHSIDTGGSQSRNGYQSSNSVVSTNSFVRSFTNTSGSSNSNSHNTVVDMTFSDDENNDLPTFPRDPTSIQISSSGSSAPASSVLPLPADGRITFSLFIDGYWRDISVDCHLPCRKTSTTTATGRRKGKIKQANTHNSCFKTEDSSKENHAGNGYSGSDNTSTSSKNEASASTVRWESDTNACTQLQLPTPAFCKPSSFYHFDIGGSSDSGGGSGRYTLCHQLWVPFLEKAYAKTVGSYNSIHGGEIDEALLDLTGCPTEKIVFSHSYFDSEEFWIRLCSFHEVGFPMGASSGSGGSGGGGGRGGGGALNSGGVGFSRLIVGNHAYSVLNVVQLSEQEAESSGLSALLMGAPAGGGCGIGVDVGQQGVEITDFFTLGGTSLGGGCSFDDDIMLCEERQRHQNVNSRRRARVRSPCEEVPLRWLKLRNPWGVAHRHSVSNTSNDRSSGRRLPLVHPLATHASFRGDGMDVGSSNGRLALVHEIAHQHRSHQQSLQEDEDDDNGSFWISYHEFLIKFEDVNVCKAHVQRPNMEVDEVDNRNCHCGESSSTATPWSADIKPDLSKAAVNTTTNHTLSMFNSSSSLAFGAGQWSFLSVNDFTSPNQLLTRSYFVLHVPDPAVVSATTAPGATGMSPNIWVYFTVLQRTKRGSYASTSVERNKYWYADATLIVSRENSCDSTYQSNIIHSGSRSSQYIYGSTSSGCKRSSRSLECQLAPGDYRITVAHFLPQPDPASYVLRLYSSKPVIHVGQQQDYQNQNQKQGQDQGQNLDAERKSIRQYSHVCVLRTVPYALPISNCRSHSVTAPVANSEGDDSVRVGENKLKRARFETAGHVHQQQGTNTASTFPVHLSFIRPIVDPRTEGEELLARVISGGDISTSNMSCRRERLIPPKHLPRFDHAVISSSSGGGGGGSAVIDLTNDDDDSGGDGGIVNANIGSMAMPRPPLSQMQASVSAEVYCVRLCGSVRVLQLEVTAPLNKHGNYSHTQSHSQSESRSQSQSSRNDQQLLVSVSVACCGFKICSPFIVLDKPCGDDVTAIDRGVGLSIRRDYQTRGRVPVFYQTSASNFKSGAAKLGSTDTSSSSSMHSTGVGVGISILKFRCFLPATAGRATGSVTKLRLNLGVFIACSLPYQATAHSITLWGTDAVNAQTVGNNNCSGGSATQQPSLPDLPAVFQVMSL